MMVDSGYECYKCGNDRKITLMIYEGVKKRRVCLECLNDMIRNRQVSLGSI